MYLSLEAYRNIVKNVGSRADIAALCRVSKGFQYAAERALYNTLYMQDIGTTMLLCATLTEQPRVAACVDALTLHAGASSEDESEEEGEEVPHVEELPEGYWPTISLAFRKLSRLRYLNIHIGRGVPSSNTWILDDCPFHLRSFHCDLDWDAHLVKFLENQQDLDDLYIIDYKDSLMDASVAPPTTISPLSANSLPNLATLECTFTEAAAALAPRRPLIRLKTCFSRSDPDAKRVEMTTLFAKIQLSTAELRSLDIADSTYEEPFSVELLSTIVGMSRTARQLRYLGTLALPVAGRERLRFYGMLMRLPRLDCIEVEVSGWQPVPSTLAAFRALASELRLYCPTVVMVVFVHEFERTVITYVDGLYRIDEEVGPELLWRSDL
ncbi:uncharacterized protein BT62DRAFT_249998 [Guyanagaster necrorhizus]|uniref:Uncharacterized protein n=1 Tax=Guyanagaster necrorhizus TaxID=856835 RepID=A0A9P8AQJ8_9AGAR|nr:uncharacterized protein BT62DRAFT_249998 [Guyanagaster necrorhizus MCA 3950]KAG7444065.1 hypothetical protein BT62DRAFT_249998 [Guyanagaster necrorhizus MCA 3950]